MLVNGLGATPKEELYILFRSVREILASSGIAVRRTWVGEYATSLEMAGASVSLLRLDDELARLLDAPCESPFISQKRWSAFTHRRRQDELCEPGLAGLLAMAADAVASSAAELNRLDGFAGDGDLGITMSAAARALKEVLASDQQAEPDEAARRLWRGDRAPRALDQRDLGGHRLPSCRQGGR